MTEEETRVEEAVEANRTFTFESGTTVTIKRINNLFVGKVSLAAEKAWAAENGEPVCPTYSVKIAGGGEEVHDHNDVTIATEPWSEDEEIQTAWQEFQSAEQQRQAARIEATAKVCLKKGVIDDPPDEWREECEHFGVDVPDHPLDAKWEWLYDVSMGWSELIDCAWAIQFLRSPLEESATAAESLFPDPLGTSGTGSDADGDSEEAE